LPVPRQRFGNDYYEGDANVSAGRHRRVKSRPSTRRIALTAIPVAALLTASVGVAVGWPGFSHEPPEPEQISALDDRPREAPLSRAANRAAPPNPTNSPTVSLTTPEPTTEAEPEPTETPSPEPDLTVTGQMYVTTALNVRIGPGSDHDVLTVLARGATVDITDTTEGDWVQIVHDDRAAWVNGDYLSSDKPSAETQPAQSNSGGISYAECPHGSSVEQGLTPDAVRVYRAVCAQFPEVTDYLGLRSGGGAHSEGRAVDIMVYSNSALGDAIAAWVRENHKALGVSEIIWAQRIWTVQRSSEGWRWMEDRGSATANHYDHVHVTVYGNSGG
jgi:hypothetical protein